MEPEAVPAGFVTGDYLHVLRESEADLGGGDLRGGQDLQVPGRDVPQPWLLCRTDGDRRTSRSSSRARGKSKAPGRSGR